LGCDAVGKEPGQKPEVRIWPVKRLGPLFAAPGDKI